MRSFSDLLKLLFEEKRKLHVKQTSEHSVFMSMGFIPAVLT